MKHEDETQQRRQRKNCKYAWSFKTCWAKTKIFEKKTCLRKNQFLQVIYICGSAQHGCLLQVQHWQLSVWSCLSGGFQYLSMYSLVSLGKYSSGHIFWMSNFDLSYCHLNVLAGYVPQMHEWGVREDWRVHSFYANPVCSRRPCAMPGCLAACEDQT